MKNHSRPILFLVIFLLISFISEVFAKDNVFNHIPQSYIGIRPMAMGNAFTAVLGDHNTLFYNSAGLYDQNDKHLIINLFRYGVSTGDNSIQDLFRDLRAAGRGTGTQRTDELTRMVTSKYGHYYYGQFSPLSVFYMQPGTELAFIPMDTSIRIKIDKQVGPAISLQLQNDSTLAWGKGFSLDQLLNGLRIGANFKLRYRAFFQRVIPILEYERNKDLFSTKYAQEGVGFDMDVGLLYKMEEMWKVKPALGLNLKNLFNTGFRENVRLINKKTGNPPDDDQRLDLGGALTFQKLWIFTPLASADIRDIGQENFSLEKSYHLGTEFKFQLTKHLTGSLLGGVNQGYLTYGVSLQSFWYLFEFASYGEEVGATGANIENRVSMVKLALFF